MKTIFFTLPLVALSLAMPATPVSAQTPDGDTSWGHRRHKHYSVYTRECIRSPWQLYACYDCPREADRVAHDLHHQGYRTKVECE